MEGRRRPAALGGGAAAPGHGRLGAEIETARDHGAVGVFFRGVEGDRSLAESYFFPVYEAANRLGMAICIHTGAGAPDITRCSTGTSATTSPTCAHCRCSPSATSWPTRSRSASPSCASASSRHRPHGCPTCCTICSAPAAPGSTPAATPTRTSTGDPTCFRDYRLYVAAEADEDLPYLLTHIGEDHIIMGSDYGHQDQSREDGMVAVMRRKENVSPRVVEKILCHNPRRFYGLG